MRGAATVVARLALFAFDAASLRELAAHRAVGAVRARSPAAFGVAATRFARGLAAHHGDAEPGAAEPTAGDRVRGGELRRLKLQRLVWHEA